MYNILRNNGIKFVRSFVRPSPASATASGNYNHHVHPAIAALSAAQINDCHSNQSHFVIHTQHRNFSLSLNLKGVFEPDVPRKFKVPKYNRLILELKGYDYVVLESYAKYVHNLLTRMKVRVRHRPNPSENFKIETYQPNSSVVLSEYHLKEYCRSYKFRDMPTPKLQVVLEMVHAHLPEGVKIVTRKEGPASTERSTLYLRDNLAEELQKQMEEIAAGKKNKIRK